NQFREIDGAKLANLPAGDRQRVRLKSPVREYRPPGSVRGAPGNRRPYLDNVECRVRKPGSILGWIMESCQDWRLFPAERGRRRQTLKLGKQSPPVSFETVE